MSSHWEWEKEVVAAHEANRPYAPENGQPLKFKAGDRVIFTNCYGVWFRCTVTGLYRPEKVDSLYATGRRYMLDYDCHWMPATEESLSVDNEEDKTC